MNYTNQEKFIISQIIISQISEFKVKVWVYISISITEQERYSLLYIFLVC